MRQVVFSIIVASAVQEYLMPVTEMNALTFLRDVFLVRCYMVEVIVIHALRYKIVQNTGETIRAVSMIHVYSRIACGIITTVAQIIIKTVYVIAMK